MRWAMRHPSCGEKWASRWPQCRNLMFRWRRLLPLRLKRSKHTVSEKKVIARKALPQPCRFYGWAVVLEYYSDVLYFRPVAPTNHLKMHPWWNHEAEELANEVRGAMKQATLWPVQDHHWKRIRRGITA